MVQYLKKKKNKNHMYITHATFRRLFIRHSYIFRLFLETKPAEVIHTVLVHIHWIKIVIFLRSWHRFQHYWNSLLDGRKDGGDVRRREGGMDIIGEDDLGGEDDEV
jgi:hypothetical protein